MMSRRIWFVVALACVGLSGVGGILWWTQRSEYDLTRHAIAPDLHRAWPLTHFWTWTAKMPPLTGQEVVSLRVHTRSAPLDKQGNSSLHSATAPQGPIKFAESEASARAANFPASSDIGGNGPLEVSVQLIDLSVVSTPTTRPTTENRLRATVARGGAQLFLTGDDNLPLRGRISGWSTRTDQNWNGNVLLLMRFWVKDEERERQFDVMLVRKRDLSDQVP